MEKNIDSLVLGCTHYPLLKTCIGETVGPQVILVDPAKETALELKRYLTENNMLRDENSCVEHEFYISDDTEMFDKICRKALNRSCKAEMINIELY